MNIYTVIVDPQEGGPSFIDNVYPATEESRESIKNSVQRYEEEGCCVTVYVDHLTCQGRKTIRMIYPVLAPSYAW